MTRTLDDKTVEDRLIEVVEAAGYRGTDDPERRQAADIPSSTADAVDGPANAILREHFPQPRARAAAGFHIRSEREEVKYQRRWYNTMKYGVPLRDYIPPLPLVHKNKAGQTVPIANRVFDLIEQRPDLKAKAERDGPNAAYLALQQEVDEVSWNLIKPRSRPTEPIEPARGEPDQTWWLEPAIKELPLIQQRLMEMVPDFLPPRGDPRRLKGPGKLRRLSGLTRNEMYHQLKLAYETLRQIGRTKRQEDGPTAAPWTPHWTVVPVDMTRANTRLGLRTRDERSAWLRKRRINAPHLGWYYVKVGAEVKRMRVRQAHLEANLRKYWQTLAGERLLMRLYPGQNYLNVVRVEPFPLPAEPSLLPTSE
jgi:hypothetical protein